MSNAPRTALTWPALLVVLGLITFLIGLLIPIRWAIGGNGQGFGCRNNQRQIVLAMSIYLNDNDQHWPSLTVDGAGRFVPADSPSLDATATAIASLEFITAQTGGDLSIKLFACPAAHGRRPATTALPELGTTAWTSAWAAAGPATIGYSYDWSVPPSAAASRAVTADRDQTVHKGIVAVAFADGHVGHLKPDAGQWLNPEVRGDDIYTGYGDGPMTTPGMGSATRAWIR